MNAQHQVKTDVDGAHESHPQTLNKAKQLLYVYHCLFGFFLCLLWQLFEYYNPGVFETESFWSMGSSAVLLLDIDIQFPRKIRTFIDYWTSTSDILKKVFIFFAPEHNCGDDCSKTIRFRLCTWWYDGSKDVKLPAFFLQND